MAGTVKADTIQSELTTPTVFQNTSGTEIGRFCRAWVNLNGTGTIAVRRSFNVSSLIRQATGQYSYNLTTAVSDANYSLSVSRSDDATATSFFVYGAVPISTTQARLGSFTSPNFVDSAYMTSIICS